jgi:hypothetical protein
LPRLGAKFASRENDWSDIWLDGVEDSQTGEALKKEALERLPKRSSQRTIQAESKTQFLSFVEELLARAAHLPQWAIVHAADGYLAIDELVETIRRVRTVKTIYTKDFSEWMGVRASIITA